MKIVTIVRTQSSLALAWVGFSPLGLDVKVHRPDQLKEGIVLCLGIALFVPVVAIHQLTKEDFDLEQSKVEANAHPASHGKPRLQC